MRFIIILVTLFLVTLGQDLMQPGPTPGRFSKILFPKNAFFLAPRVFNDWAVRAPGPRLWPNDLLDYCTISSKTIASDMPDLFGPNGPPNPCERYFCNANTPPFYYSKSMNKTFDSQTRADAANTHIYMHRYCVQCEQTSEERFDLNYIRLGPRICPQFRNITSLNQCEGNSTFLYYTSAVQLCYLKDRNIYVDRDDGVHSFLVPMYLVGNSAIELIGAAINIVLLVFIVGIPLWVALIRKCMNFQQLTNNPTLAKIKLAFSFSNLLLSLFWINAIQAIFFALLDITDVFQFSGRFRNISQAVSALIVVILLFLIFVQWYHISNLVGEGTNFTTLQKIMIFAALVIILGWVGIGFLFYFTSAWVPLNHEDYFNRFVSEGIWLAISGVAMGAAQLGILIYGIIILRTALNIDLKGKSSAEITMVVLKIRLTKNLLLYLFCSFISIIFMFYSSLTYIIAPDILTIAGYFVINTFQTIWSALVPNILILAFVDLPKIRQAYCCCIPEKDDDDEKKGNYMSLRRD